MKGYLQGAGFNDVAVHPFVPGVLSRVAGRKPLKDGRRAGLRAGPFDYLSPSCLAPFV